MAKLVFGTVLIFLSFFFGIAFVASLSRNEKISMTKVIFYSAFCSILSVAAIAAIIFLF